MIKVTDMLTKYNHKEGRTQQIKYIVIHYVGATGSAKANCEYYKTDGVGASAHYFVDFNGDVYRSVKDQDTAWHCGASKYVHPECRNANAIGIEMCVRCSGSKANTSKDWYFEDATVEAAIELTKELMEKYGIDADHVIRHYDVTGKICPNPYVYNHTKHTWDAFKEAIAAKGEWKHLPDGKWLYIVNGNAVSGEWRKINHHWYYFGADGYMITGLQTVNNRICYLTESGPLEGAMQRTDEDGYLTEWYVD